MPGYAKPAQKQGYPPGGILLTASSSHHTTVARNQAAKRIIKDIKDIHNFSGIWKTEPFLTNKELNRSSLFICQNIVASFDRHTANGLLSIFCMQRYKLACAQHAPNTNTGIWF